PKTDPRGERRPRQGPRRRRRRKGGAREKRSLNARLFLFFFLLITRRFARRRVRRGSLYRRQLLLRFLFIVRSSLVGVSLQSPAQPSRRLRRAGRKPGSRAVRAPGRGVGERSRHKGPPEHLFRSGFGNERRRRRRSGGLDALMNRVSIIGRWRRAHRWDGESLAGAPRFPGSGDRGRAGPGLG